MAQPLMVVVVVALLGAVVLAVPIADYTKEGFEPVRTPPKLQKVVSPVENKQENSKRQNQQPDNSSNSKPFTGGQILTRVNQGTSENEVLGKQNTIVCDKTALSRDALTSYTPENQDVVLEEHEASWVQQRIHEECDKYSTIVVNSALQHVGMLEQARSDECRVQMIREHCAHVQAMQAQQPVKAQEDKNPRPQVRGQCNEQELSNISMLRQSTRDLTQCAIHGMVGEHGVVRYCNLKRDENAKPARVAYAILAHRSAHMVARLVSAIYDPENVYVVHADKSSLKLDDVEAQLQDALCTPKSPCHLPSNVRVINTVAVSWGTISVFDALHAAVSELLEMSQQWSHVINLSESDYPLQSQRVITTFLGRYGSGVNFIDIHNPAIALDDKRWRGRELHTHCEGRSLSLQLVKPAADVKFYDGSMWSMTTREFWQSTLSPQNAALFDHVHGYASELAIPDEVMQQTLLMASHECTQVCNVNFRLENWQGGASPSLFGADDLVALDKSPAFFARKFGDDGLVDRVDAIIKAREKQGLEMSEWM